MRPVSDRSWRAFGCSHISLSCVIGLCVIVSAPAIGAAQLSPETPGLETDSELETSEPSTEVEVNPAAEDDEIAARLQRILEATNWFESVRVSVDEGVVFLEGVADREERSEWAGQLARNTQDVVAVVNRLRVRPRPLWDFSPAWSEVRSMAADTVQSLPLIALGVVLLVLTWLAVRLAMYFAERVFRRRIKSVLLREVAVRAAAVPVFILGLYLVLRVAGLTQMAATVIGGTGLLGLIVGIAFRDIAENFLASILISTQRPFHAGDLVEVNGHHGFVQTVTTRGTLLMTLEGNHVQIPNATIYKSTIVNYTANPKLRLDFLIGIDYADSVSDAQEVVLTVLQKHPAVLDDPEPMVLVEELGPSTVNLRVQFWIDGHQYSQYRVRSSIVRLAKRAIEMAGLTMPDESREVIFPRGVPVTMQEIDSDVGASRTALHPESSPTSEEDEVSLQAEGGLQSEHDEIAEQARQSRRPDDSADLLADTMAV